MVLGNPSQVLKQQMPSGLHRNRGASHENALSTPEEKEAPPASTGVGTHWHRMAFPITNGAGWSSRAHIAVAVRSEPSNRTPTSPAQFFTFPGLRLWGCHVLVPALRVVGNHNAFPARPRHRAAQPRIGRKCACLKELLRLRDPSLNAYCGGPGDPANGKCNRLATRERNSRKKCKITTLQFRLENAKNSACTGVQYGPTLPHSVPPPPRACGSLSLSLSFHS